MIYVSQDHYQLDDRQPTTIAHGYPVHAINLGTSVRLTSNYSRRPEAIIDRTQDLARFLASLPAWEQLLLQSVNLMDTPANIMHELNEGSFQSGSDGSVIALSASFGFVIASHSHRRLITGRGPAPGAKPQSFRAEAYGALAVRRILIRLSQFTAIPFTTSYHHYIDNKGVIQRIQTEEKRTFHIPNKTLAPDWDVLAMTLAPAPELPPNIVSWVKGHQDDDKPRETLSIAAQLNCEADDEAGQYQEDHGAARPLAPMFPNTHAQLVISGNSVNSYYKSRIREASTLPTYYKYLENRNDWTVETRNEVDWSVYKQIIRQFYDRHTTLVKHLHGIAPSGHIAHRNNKHYPLACPSCDCPDETNDHILCCPAQSRREWRTKTLHKMTQTTQQSDNDPTLVDILRDGIRRWTAHLPNIEPAAYPAPYRPLIASQNRIGWSHLYRARWSIQWKFLHEAYARRLAITGQKADGTRWVHKLGKLFLQSWFELWKIRNDERHGTVRYCEANPKGAANPNGETTSKRPKYDNKHCC
jgi:hypothetical protein